MADCLSACSWNQHWGIGEAASDSLGSLWRFPPLPLLIRTPQPLLLTDANLRDGRTDVSITCSLCAEPRAPPADRLSPFATLEPPWALALCLPGMPPKRLCLVGEQKLERGVSSGEGIWVTRSLVELDEAEV